MNLPSKKSIFLYIAVFILAAVFVIVIFSGIKSGREVAQSEATASQAKILAEALGYFSTDRDRFPSGIEFSDEAVMLSYLSRIPQESDYGSGACPQKFSYRSFLTKGFELYFCLPKAVLGYNKGWNKIEKTF